MKRTSLLDMGLQKATEFINQAVTETNKYTVRPGASSQLVERAKSDQYDKAREKAFSIDHEDRESQVYKRKQNVYVKDKEDLEKVAYSRMPKEEQYGVTKDSPKIHHPLLKKKTKSSLRQGIIFSEVLGKPKGF